MKEPAASADCGEGQLGYRERTASGDDEGRGRDRDREGWAHGDGTGIVAIEAHYGLAA